jgi:hypothetical protein
MLRPIIVALCCILALAAGQSDERCFITNDWRDGTIVPGEPNVLIWDYGGPNRDVLLSTINDTEAAYIGAIAREFITLPA